MAQGIDAISNALRNDREERVRIAAVKALSWINTEHVIQPIIYALEDRNWNVRAMAAQELRKLGDLRALEPLRELLNDDDPTVSGLASNAINDIEKKNSKS